jgi:metal-responsive CopG/Arc/MetJ family transcriptional regulator
LVKRVGFQIKEEELWKKFLRAIEGKFDTASEAIRSLIREYVEEWENQ